MKMLRRIAIGCALVAGLAMTQGCFLFVVGAVAAGSGRIGSTCGAFVEDMLEGAVDHQRAAITAGGGRV